MAQGLANVLGSRSYGIKFSWVLANSTRKSGSPSTSGIFQGSVPFAMYPSESTKTGTR
ncbi:unannotated protein [freshwater metagenome]|uniref:Unannotated protein n=1 Tax=freshwater metagenome TaxID=449393 RepID=A0A6J6GWG3_9ZZZZ